MSKTKMFSAGWLGAAVVLLLLIPLVLSACGGATEAPTEPPEPTEVAAQPTTAPTQPPPPTDAPTDPPPTDVPTEPPPTEAPTATPTEAPTATPTEEPTPEVVDDTACIACHTDQETLMAVAEEEEVPEVESEGEG